MILGIDEVGRGSWAGPLVIGAVVLGGANIDGLTDSKKLSKKHREELDIQIREQAAGYGLGWVTATEIDKIGLSESLRLATRRAVEQVKAPYHEIIIDGTINFLADTTKGKYVTTMAKADLLVPSVSAASIIAKVARDTYMAEQGKIYDGYKFASHVGYGTAAHRAAIEKLGLTPLHRLSFAPFAKYREATIRHPDSLSIEDSGSNENKSKSIGLRIKSAVTALNKSKSITKPGSQIESGMTTQTTKKIGDTAEDEAANHLVRLGHEIIERNWKTKYCEIDIVSHRAGTIFFTEVKYRKSPDQGGGIAAITSKKLNQMKFAGRLYVQSRSINDKDLLLAVMTLTAKPPAVEEFITLTEL